MALNELSSQVRTAAKTEETNDVGYIGNIAASRTWCVSVRRSSSKCVIVQESDRLTVIDAGMPRLLPRSRAGLDQIGRSLQDIDAVLITHGHPDHIGMAENATQNIRWRRVGPHIGRADTGRASTCPATRQTGIVTSAVSAAPAGGHRRAAAPGPHGRIQRTGRHSALHLRQPTSIGRAGTTNSSPHTRAHPR